MAVKTFQSGNGSKIIDKIFWTLRIQYFKIEKLQKHSIKSINDENLKILEFHFNNSVMFCL